MSRKREYYKYTIMYNNVNNVYVCGERAPWGERLLFKIFFKNRDKQFV